MRYYSGTVWYEFMVKFIVSAVGYELMELDMLTVSVVCS